MIQKKVEQFFTKYPTVVCVDNEKIINEDDEYPSVFYITSGVVAQADIGVEGQDIHLNTYKVGAFFPMLPHISGIKNTYYFTAQGRVVLKRVPPSDVLNFLRENPDILLDLTRRLYIGVDGLLMRMATLLAGDARARVMTELKIAVARFHKNDNAVFVYNTTHRQIAAQTGLTRETVSRTLKEFENEGLVELRRSTLVVRIDNLRRTI